MHYLQRNAKKIFLCYFNSLIKMSSCCLGKYNCIFFSIYRQAAYLFLLFIAKTMTRIKVNSDTLLSVGYEPDSELLELEFPGKAVYEYHKVHPVIYMGLMHTEAKEDYFDKHIRDKFRYTVVKESSL